MGKTDVLERQAPPTDAVAPGNGYAVASSLHSWMHGENGMISGGCSETCSPADEESTSHVSAWNQELRQRVDSENDAPTRSVLKVLSDQVTGLSKELSVVQKDLANVVGRENQLEAHLESAERLQECVEHLERLLNESSDKLARFERSIWGRVELLEQYLFGGGGVGEGGGAGGAVEVPQVKTNVNNAYQERLAVVEGDSAEKTAKLEAIHAQLLHERHAREAQQLAMQQRLDHLEHDRLQYLERATNEVSERHKRVESRQNSLQDQLTMEKAAREQHHIVVEDMLTKDRLAREAPERAARERHLSSVMERMSTIQQSLDVVNFGLLKETEDRAKDMRLIWDFLTSQAFAPGTSRSLSPLPTVRQRVQHLQHHHLPQPQGMTAPAAVPHLPLTKQLQTQSVPQMEVPQQVQQLWPWPTALRPVGGQTRSIQFAHSPPVSPQLQATAPLVRPNPPLPRAPSPDARAVVVHLAAPLASSASLAPTELAKDGPDVGSSARSVTPTRHVAVPLSPQVQLQRSLVCSSRGSFGLAQAQAPVADVIERGAP